MYGIRVGGDESTLIFGPIGCGAVEKSAYDARPSQITYDTLVQYITKTKHYRHINRFAHIPSVLSIVA